MIHKNIGRKYMILMIGTMLIVMVSLYMILGENVAGSMVTGYMILFMGIMLGAYLLAMFLLVRTKKNHQHHMINCVKCGTELLPGNLICPECGYEKSMRDLHEKIKGDE